jgi:hypothetical protein
MTPAEYLEAVKERLLADPVVAEFRVRRHRATSIDAHIRARVTVADGSLLEFSEYVARDPNDELQVLVYSYHWESQEGVLITRWDNTPHFPRLNGFPNHIHDGHTNNVLPGQPMDICAVLDHIRGILGTPA